MGNFPHKEGMQNEWDVVPITKTFGTRSTTIIKLDENSPEGKNAAAIDDTINQCKENGKYDNVNSSQIQPLGGGSLKKKKIIKINNNQTLLPKIVSLNKVKQVKMNIKKKNRKNRKMNITKCVIELKDKKFYYDMNEKMKEMDVIKKFIKETNYKNEHIISLFNRSTKEKNYYVIKNTKQHRIRRIY